MWMMLLPAIQVLAQGIGFEAGVNLNTLRATMSGVNTESPLRVGFRGGVVVDEALSDKISIMTGAFYSARGGNIKYTKTSGDNGATIRQTTDGYVRLDYVEVPIHFLYNIQTANANKWFFGGGPYVAMAWGGLIGFDRVTTHPGGQTTSRVLMPAWVGYEPGDDFTPLDAGIGIQAGYELLKGFYTRAHASYGFVDVDPTANTMKHAGMGITVGYMIR